MAEHYMKQYPIGVTREGIEEMAEHAMTEENEGDMDNGNIMAVIARGAHVPADAGIIADAVADYDYEE